MGRNTSKGGARGALDRVAKVSRERPSKRQRLSSHPTFVENNIPGSIHTMASDRQLPSRVNPLMTEEVPTCKARQWDYMFDLLMIIR